MEIEQIHEPFWKRHLDKIGVGGSLFAALCCLGFPALLAILSAVGLGFLVNDAVLTPMLVLFLLVTLAGLLWRIQRPAGVHIPACCTSFLAELPPATLAQLSQRILRRPNRHGSPLFLENREQGRIETGWKRPSFREVANRVALAELPGRPRGARVCRKLKRQPIPVAV